MILPKITRQRIYAGKVVDIAWPVGESEPKVGEHRTIQSAPGKRAPYRLRIVSVRSTPTGFRAAVVLDGDPVRLLGKQTGYTDFAGRAIGSSKKPRPGNLNEEPEAINEADHDRIHKEAQAAGAWAREQKRLRDEKMALEFKAARMVRRGRRASVTAIEQRITRLDGRIEDAA